jgi:hypothetical protein
MHASARYSPLAQIARDSVRHLRVAWHWRPPDHAVMQCGARGRGYGSRSATESRLAGNASGETASDGPSDVSER